VKMQIEDLMDLYVGEDAAELGERLPPLPEPGKDHRRPVVPMKKRSHVRRTVGIAASILIVLGVAGALMLGFGNRQTGSTLAPGETPPNVSQWGVVPSQGPDSASESEQEAAQSDVDMQPEADKINPVLMEGVSSDYIEYSLNRCQGNLFFDGKQYYTLRDGQIVPTEVQTIHIDFYAYGDWDLYIDYIIDQDGNLALRDRSQNDVYFYVKPVSGSGDTLRITVRRLEQSHVENCDYPVFYNIETGEIMDPLANVPELFDHGDPSVIQVSPSRRWALVDCFEYVEDGDSYFQTGHNEYLCDLETGSMVLLEDAMYTDDMQNLELTNAFWGSDDTLYVWFSERTALEEDAYWMTAYVPESGTRGELHRCLNDPHNIHTEARDYLGEFYDAGGLLYLLVTDAANGTQWTLTDVDLNGSTCCSEVPNRLVLKVGGRVYLVDEVEKGYVCLNDLLAMPEEMIDAITLQSENFLCIYTERGCYCYVLLEITETTPLTQWQPD
jgi:hypothetical protein